MEKNEALQNLSKLYDKKQECMTGILKVTESYKFIGDESEVDAIVEFIDKRQKYMDDVDNIDNLIKNISTSQNIDLSVFQKKRDDIKKTVEKIIRLDEEKKVVVNKLFAQTGTENKKFLSRKAASIGYISGAANLGNSRFDTKK